MPVKKRWYFFSLVCLIVFCIACSITSAASYPGYADLVIDSSIGGGSENKENYPGDALGPEQITISRQTNRGQGGDVALYGGYLVLDMGADDVILDKSGNDLRIWEVSHPDYTSCGPEENYYVYVSQDLREWHYIGEGWAVDEFDLSTSGLLWARYVKIVDGDSSINQKYGGADIDAVEALHYGPAPSDGDDLDAVLILHFNEGSGTIAYDSSPNGNDGNIHGASWASGISGWALRFDGSNDYVEIPHDRSLDLTNYCTITAWIKYPRIPDPEQYFLSKSYGVNNYEYSLSVRTNGEIQAAIGGSSFIQPESGVLSPNQWYFVAVTYAYPGYCKLYINGVEKDLIRTSAPIKPTNQDLLIGNLRPYNHNFYYEGYVDEVIIFNKELSSGEIISMYNSRGSSPSQTSIQTALREVNIPQSGSSGDNNFESFTLIFVTAIIVIGAVLITYLVVSKRKKQ